MFDKPPEREGQDLEKPMNMVLIESSGTDVLQDQTDDSIKPRPCSISTLSYELLVRIFMLVIDTKDSDVIALSSTCRLWRTIILDMPAFWRHLTISKKTTQEKLDTWLQRAGGTLSSLRLTEGFDFDVLTGLSGSASAKIWSSLEHLEIQSDVSLATLLPPTAYKELQLESLFLTTTRPSPEFCDALWAIDVSRMRVFQTKFKIDTSLMDPIPIAGSRFTGLVTLRLHGVVEESALLDVLERNPMLETLGLSGSILREPVSSRRVELVNLTILELSENEDVEGLLQCVSFPNLKILCLLVSTLRSSEVLVANTFARLEELCLLGSNIHSSALIALLRKANALRRLVFMIPLTLDLNATNSIFEALASPNPGELEGTPRTLCCPRLQHVSLIRVMELTTESVMGLVQARLPSIGSAATLEESAVRPLPIVHLDLSDCPFVDRSSLPWFKDNVPEFIFR